MLAVITIAFIAFIALASIAMTTIQFRRITPLTFSCAKCGREFRQPPHHDFPRACPHCRVENWSLR
jgi:hypothetical protein